MDLSVATEKSIQPRKPARARLPCEENLGLCPRKGRPPPQLKLFALQGSPERLVVSAGEASGLIKLSPNAIAEVRSQSG